MSSADDWEEYPLRAGERIHRQIEAVTLRLWSGMTLAEVARLPGSPGLRTLRRWTAKNWYGLGKEYHSLVTARAIVRMREGVLADLATIQRRQERRVRTEKPDKIMAPKRRLRAPKSLTADQRAKLFAVVREGWLAKPETGYSIRQIAAAVGISKSTLSDWVLGPLSDELEAAVSRDRAEQPKHRNHPGVILDEGRASLGHVAVTADNAGGA